MHTPSSSVRYRVNHMILRQDHKKSTPLIMEYHLRCRPNHNYLARQECLTHPIDVSSSASDQPRELMFLSGKCLKYLWNLCMSFGLQFRQAKHLPNYQLTQVGTHILLLLTANMDGNNCSVKDYIWHLQGIMV